jgi:hypothetical protein
MYDLGSQTRCSLEACTFYFFLKALGLTEVKREREPAEGIFLFVSSESHAIANF